MNRTVLAIVVTSLLSAVTGAAVTWLVAFPRAVAAAKASGAGDEQAESSAVAAQLHAVQQAHDHDAIAKVVESLRAAVQPLRHGMTIAQHRAVFLRNAAAIAAVLTKAKGCSIVSTRNPPS